MTVLYITVSQAPQVGPATAGDAAPPFTQHSTAFMGESLWLPLLRGTTLITDSWVDVLCSLCRPDVDSSQLAKEQVEHRAN